MSQERGVRCEDEAPRRITRTRSHTESDGGLALDDGSGDDNYK